MNTEWLNRYLFTLVFALGAAIVSSSIVRADENRSDRFPTVTLTTQDGEKVEFYADLVKDKTVVVNFMYTECQGFCERATQNLVQVQKALGDRLGKEVFIYSITLDPTHDTPEVLKAYAEKHGAKAGWTFLTGKLDDISALRASLGLSDASSQLRNKLGLAASNVDGGIEGREHSAMIALGNDAFNRWNMASTFSRPDQILQLIERMKPPKR